MSVLKFLLDRSMVHIKRWGFSPAKIQDEDDSQHHAAVSRIAYCLSWLLRFHGIRKRIDPAAIAMAGAYHDEGEAVTGDFPATLKNVYKDVRKVTARWETRALPFLFSGAPPELADHLRGLVTKANFYGGITGQIVRYADDLSALSFALSEIELGNTGMISTRDNILAVCASRQWRWLRRLRKQYPEELP